MLINSSAIPNSLSSPSSTICLIVADPQRAFKDILEHPSFPADLRPRISKVIGISKLGKRYKSYESQRQLRSEYDLFLADDRIITYLPKILGKAFFKSASKRPFPISIEGGKKAEGNVKGEKKLTQSACTPQKLANEIIKAQKTALVALSASTCTSVRVGAAGWEADQIAENAEAVVQGLVDKYVPRGWRGVKSFYLKAHSTASLPIWLADELWQDDKDVVENAATGEIVLAIEGGDDKKSKKRKSIGEEDAEATAEKKAKKTKGDDLAKEIAARKEKLAKQKAAAIEGANPTPSILKTKTSKKSSGDGKVKKTKTLVMA
jgi:ribosome biogenesis protein UTP30